MASTTKFIVHHLNNSRSLRIIWLLEELKLNYEIKKYQRGSDMLAPPELKEVHPMGKAPIVTIEEGGQSIVLAETGAIVEYIINKHGQSLAIEQSNASNYAKYLYWLHFSEGTVMANLILGMLCTIVPKRAPFLVRGVISAGFSGLQKQRVEPELEKAFTYMENELKAAGGEFFVGGKLTGADIMLEFPTAGFLGTLPEDQGFPTLRAWLKKIQSRPAFIASEEKGGKNELGAFTK